MAFMERKRLLESIPDDELLRRLAEILRQSRRVESDLVAHMAEVEERKLYAREASSSMFAYCTDVLHLSGAEAYLRIAAARASRKHPVVLDMLADGRLHLTAIAMLAPHITAENRDTLLIRAIHRTKPQIEELIAELDPQPDAPTVMRKLPSRPILQQHPDGVESPVCERRPDGVEAPGFELRPDAVAPRDRTPAVIQPLSPGRYKVQFTVSAELHDKLQRLKALMRSKAPDGDLAAIIEEAVTEKLERLEAKRFAKVKAPRKGLGETDTSPSSRYIPAAVRRVVTERDGYQCRYVDSEGRRCSERGGLEFHHRGLFALGGDHSPKNIGLMCRTHNAYLAEHDYGQKKMDRHRRSRSGHPRPSGGVTSVAEARAESRD